MSGVAPTAEEMAQAARAAVASGDWATARALFEALVEREPAPEALAGLGDTLWWLGRTGEAIRYQEQAYAAFRRCGDPAQSALMAAGLYLLYRVSLGNTAAARGWLARAARLVDEAGLGPLAGWVVLLRAHDSDDAVAAERWSREARESATGFAPRRPPGSPSSASPRASLRRLSACLRAWKNTSPAHTCSRRSRWPAVSLSQPGGSRCAVCGSSISRTASGQAPTGPAWPSASKPGSCGSCWPRHRRVQRQRRRSRT